MSEEGDIGFRVYYVQEDKKVEVVPSQRIDSHLMMESGAISCWRSTSCQFVSQFFSLLTRQQCPLRCRFRRIRQQFQLPALQEDLVRHRRGTAGNLGRCHTAKTAASLAY